MRLRFVYEKNSLKELEPISVLGSNCLWDPGKVYKIGYKYSLNKASI